MHRDLDLFRKILLETASAPIGKILWHVEFEGKTEAEIYEHFALLIEAGLVEGHVVRDSYGLPVKGSIMRLTNSGHDFLSNARNDSAWDRVKKRLADEGVSVSIEIMKQMLVAAVKELTGVK